MISLYNLLYVAQSELSLNFRESIILIVEFAGNVLKTAENRSWRVIVRVLARSRKIAFGNYIRLPRSRSRIYAARTIGESREKNRWCLPGTIQRVPPSRSFNGFRVTERVDYLCDLPRSASDAKSARSVLHRRNIPERTLRNVISRVSCGESAPFQRANRIFRRGIPLRSRTMGLPTSFSGFCRTATGGLR